MIDPTPIPMAFPDLREAVEKTREAFQHLSTAIHLQAERPESDERVEDVATCALRCLRLLPRLEEMLRFDVARVTGLAVTPIRKGSAP